MLSRYNNPRYYNIAKIPSISLLYRIKDDGECCYLYLESLNGEFKIYKQSLDDNGNDTRRMIYDTMHGGNNFAEIQCWYYSNDIENFENIGDIELNNNNAKHICYKNNKYLDYDDKLNQNIIDIKFMINMYLTDLNNHLTSSNHIKKCMTYYQIFNHSPNDQYGKIIKQEQYDSFIDEYDMITDDPQFINTVSEFNEV